ncbi:MAG: molecular chaperone DnaJ [Alcanivorax borkumensis]|jgi:DnaJ like chaperone protein|nr:MULTISPECIES: co-chaperone DjlA [Alcanivorax]EUC71327.1 molecular chaperone DnaJ [Alcanivorax sp. 97CO-5]OJH07859.1 MAG: molecular chaperone DnaJ [Alcanivorax borkumensis]PKG02758.1 co-chaperone DjlA [Alcanivorax sp. 97CO-6]BAP14157.1 DnaJ-like protein DjlA [Alcanivorax sp. NBRC 101098]
MQFNWGGKIILGLLGMLVGGPVGLGIGLLIGHMLDKGTERVQTFNPFRPYGPGEQSQIQRALFDTVFSIMGHLAKADGRVSEDEIAQARAVMDRMQLSEEQRKQAIALFNQGKEDNFPLDQVVAAFATTVKHRKQLILVLLEILLQTALADDELDPAEEAILVRVAEGLGVPRAQFQQILNMLLAQAQFSGSRAGGHSYQGQPAGPSRPSLSQAYKVLGITDSASNQEVKKTYRKLMSQNHPDKLAAKGVPEEMIRVATQKTAEISKAYEMIKEHRGFK